MRIPPQYDSFVDVSIVTNFGRKERMEKIVGELNVSIICPRGEFGLLSKLGESR